MTKYVKTSGNASEHLNLNNMTKYVKTAGNAPEHI